MDSAEIEQAYAPFIEAVQAGGFRTPGPDEGWTAELIVAHVTLNNDHWTRAAQDVVDGAPSAYDNETAVDARVLQDHVDTMGAAGALVQDLRRSVRDLVDVYDALGPLRSTVIPVRIVSDGEVVRDKPAAVGDMIVGNASYHQQMHFEQLLALRAL